MPRQLIEATLTTRAARGGLAPGLHWRSIDRGVHLGYRKSRRGGQWLVRWYQKSEKSYTRSELGEADDVFDEGTLDYYAAVEAGKAAVKAARRKAAADAEGPAPTVQLAVDTYLAMRNARKCATEDRDIKADASSTLTKHVLPCKKLCATRLDELTEAKLTDWREGIDPALKGTTRRRILNDFKAALNAMYRRERRRLPAELGFHQDNMWIDVRSPEDAGETRRSGLSLSEKTTPSGRAEAARRAGWSHPDSRHDPGRCRW